MNNFKIKIESIQGIKSLELELDLSSGKLMCIVGKNGVGKTTLIKSIANLLRADIFKTTSSPYIFNNDSKITYHINGECYPYTYDKKLKTIDSKSAIENTIKDNIIGELPLPHGERFNFFQAISNVDKEIREKYIAQDYIEPTELVEWYQKIYGSAKFDNLKEVRISGKKYYFLPQQDNKYIREDYFSSGEYFILSVYRLIRQGKKLIVIDELDISLDASAQVHLIGELREFCQDQSVTLIFTTHSLAIMKMLEDNELFYLENTSGQCKITKRSYNYIKSNLYQFKGWDKYILTEDKVLVDFIKHLLEDCVLNKEYIVIPIGTANSVVALMKNNENENFFSIKDNVISVLDGDQKKLDNTERVFFLPFESVEKKLKELYSENSDDPFFAGVTITEHDKKGKDLFKKIEKEHSLNKIFQFLIDSNESSIKEFKNSLKCFINR